MRSKSPVRESRRGQRGIKSTETQGSPKTETHKGVATLFGKLTRRGHQKHRQGEGLDDAVKMPGPQLRKAAPLPGIGSFMSIASFQGAEDGSFISLEGHGRQEHGQGQGAAQMPNSDTVFRPGSPDRLPFTEWVEARKSLTAK